MRWKTFKTTQTAGYLFITLSILNWGGNFVASRGLAGMAEPGTLNLMRWALATVFFAPFGLAAFWRERKEILRLFMPLSAIALCGMGIAHAEQGPLNLDRQIECHPRRQVADVKVAAHPARGNN